MQYTLFQLSPSGTFSPVGPADDQGNARDLGSRIKALANQDGSTYLLRWIDARGMWRVVLVTPKEPAVAATVAAAEGAVAKN